jgi:hypothetical protein
LNTSSDQGEYLQNSPYGINIVVGGYEFKTTSNHTGQLQMIISNDRRMTGVGENMDGYYVGSEQIISSPAIVITTGSISWNLLDSSHSALSSDALPLTAPVLSNWGYNYFEIFCSDSIHSPSISIIGTVTQATPEPLTSFLMMAGALILRCRR